MRTSGAVIAGGGSRRFGTDKRLVRIDGRALLVRTIDVLRPITSELLVVVASETDRTVVREVLGDADTDVGAHDVAVHVDARPDCGPAAGLEVALSVAREELVLVVATDHPALRPEVLVLLTARAATSDALAVALEGPYGAEPLLAVYRTAALPTLQRQLDTGVRRMQDVLAALDPVVIASSEWRALDPAGATLCDIDVPADLPDHHASDDCASEGPAEPGS
jgi:molybdopterin-guanine dinucleotide biosynthesis protein A